MLLSDFPRVLARRWYIVLLGLFATGGMVYGTLDAVPPTYSVSSEVLLLPPPTVVPAGSNPYLALGGLESIGSVASKAMTDDRTRRLVAARYGEFDYDVGLDPTAAAPMIVIQVESKSPTVSRDAERFLNDRLPTVLLELQDLAGVSSRSRISSTPIIAPDEPEIKRKSQIRAAVVVSAVGILGTVLVAGAVDALLLRRRRRSDDEPPADSETPLADDRPQARDEGAIKARGRSAGRAEDLTRVSG